MPEPIKWTQVLLSSDGRFEIQKQPADDRTIFPRGYCFALIDHRPTSGAEPKEHWPCRLQSHCKELAQTILTTERTL